MWNSKTAGIDEILLEAENLNTILEIVTSNKELNKKQKDSLLGMALTALAKEGANKSPNAKKRLCK